MAQFKTEMVAAFFAYARERYAIYKRRKQGWPWPWTSDAILQTHKFTNVFREHDRTTVWFRENVRDRLSDSTDVILATILFRWFNRIESGQVIFGQRDLLSGQTPWERLRDTGETGQIASALRSAYPRGPYITGAYIIIGEPGMPKLDGILSFLHKFYVDSELSSTGSMVLGMGADSNWNSMEEFTGWLQEFRGMGPFLAYEVACDLRYTGVLDHAKDIMTWANLGPGARRGINKMCGLRREGTATARQAWSHTALKNYEYLEKMHDLLLLSREPGMWARDGMPWDMRTVEHTLCEFDKYQRVLNGEGRPKQVYRHAGA